jgi:hypothetical protein
MLKYKFVTAEEYEESYKEAFPHAISNESSTEYLICGEGELTEEAMNAYKEANWPVTVEE